MKAYGVKRIEMPHRYIGRSNIPCSCCYPGKKKSLTKAQKKRARQDAKSQASAED